MQNSADVIVVGAGVIGLLTARELAARGAAVLVIEKGAVGMQSSQAGGGILTPIPPWRAAPAVDALAGASRPLFPQLADDLLETTGIDIEYIECGALLLGQASTPEATQWARLAGIALEEVDAKHLHELEPNLSNGHSNAMLLPQLGQLRNPRFVAALHKDLLQAGVAVREHEPAEQLLVDGDRITGVVTSTGRFEAPHVVIATGAWTTEFLGELSVTKIVPVRGQMLWYRLQPGDFGRILIDDERYLIPRRDGICLVGSTVEHAGFDCGVTAAARADLTAFAGQLSPLLDNEEPAGQWSGLRPGRADGIPVISPHPRVRGLFLNAGHYRNGINLGPASARLCAAQVLDVDPGLDASIDTRPYTAVDHL